MLLNSVLISSFFHLYWDEFAPAMSLALNGSAPLETAEPLGVEDIVLKDSLGFKAFFSSLMPNVVGLLGMPILGLEAAPAFKRRELLMLFDLTGPAR